MKKILISLLLCILFGAWSVSAQAGVIFNSTNFPDANLRKALMEALNLSGGEDFDDVLGVACLDLSGKNIKSAKGLELIAGNRFFQLLIDNNELTELDLYSPDNKYLKKFSYLSCKGNKLTSLDVSNLKLQYLTCNDNQLKTLTFGEENIKELKVLQCQNNQLTTLDLYHAVNLEGLHCYNNSLTNIHLANYEQTALTYLDCSFNKLTSLSVSAYRNLEYLYCIDNQLRTLYFSDDMYSLKEISCDKNQLIALNVSKLSGLQELLCSYNKLTYLTLPTNYLLRLNCSYNELKELDVSKGILSELDCSYNRLTSLIVGPSIKVISCQGNRLSGAKVKSFINSLPALSSNTKLCFVDETYENEGNSMSESEVQELQQKNWYPQILVVKNTPWIDYRGVSEYDLQITGVPVTVNNQGDILGDGRFSYDEASNTLTVKKGPKDGIGIKFTSTSSNPIISSHIPGLTIRFEDNATLTSSSTPLRLYSDATLTAPKADTYVYLDGEQVGIYCQGANVTLDGVYVESRLGQYGIYNYENVKTLTLKNDAGLWVEGTERAIHNFNIQMNDGIQIIDPAGGIAKNGTVYWKDGNTVAKSVYIGKPVEHSYLYVDGTEVTKDNKDDILGDGTFSYNPSSRTLTINKSYTSSNTLNPVIKNGGVDNLIINVPGDVTLSGPDMTYSDIISLTYYNTTITGGGTLRVITKDQRACGIYIGYGKILTIADVTVEAEGKNGISGYVSSTLVVTDATVHAKSTLTSNGAAIEGFSTITLNGVSYLDPEGAYVDKDGYLVDALGKRAAEVTIGVKAYDLWLSGTRVTVNNQDDILGDGNFSYDPEDNKLTVKGSLKTNDEHGIQNQINGLTIYVAKDAAIEATGYKAAIVVMSYTTITGPGLLTLRSNNDCGIYASKDATVVLDNANLDINGYWGIAGTGRGSEQLRIYDSTVKAVSTSDEGAICDFKGYLSIGGTIKVPAGGYTKDGAVVDKDGKVAKEVQIIKAFKLSVLGYPVDVDNCGDILGDGSASYDPENNRLTLWDITVDKAGAQLVNSLIDGLIIDVAGKVDVTVGSTLYYGLIDLNDASTTITGSGNLMLKGARNESCGTIFTRASSLTIENLTTDLEGKIQSAGASTLTVKNANIHVKDDYTAAVLNFKDLKLEGCSILSPTDGQVKNGTVVDANGNVAKDVKVGTFNRADVNRDGTVDSADIVAVIKEMPDGDKKADVNNDGAIDSADIVAVIKAMK